MSPGPRVLSATLFILGAVGNAQEPIHDHAAHTAPEVELDSADVPVPDVPADASRREHVPPPPPATAPEVLSHEAMAETMGMDDAARYGLMRFDQTEYREGDTFAWDMDAWYGGDYQRLWLKSEGERESDGEWEGRLEGLWSRVIGRWWSTQVGVRHDFGDGASRTWFAAGVEGLAPYFFDLEATGYVSDEGRFAARLAASYDLLLTQRLVLQPDMELTAYSKAEPSLLRGSGVSALELGLRLRYEFRRELAPYAGLEWVRSFGETSELLRANGDPTSDLRWVAGIRFWF